MTLRAQTSTAIPCARQPKGQLKTREALTRPARKPSGMAAPLDAHAKPPDAIRQIYKRYQKFDEDADIIDTLRLQDSQHVSLSNLVQLPADIRQVFLDFAGSQTDSPDDPKVYHVDAIPGKSATLTFAGHSSEVSCIRSLRLPISSPAESAAPAVVKVLQPRPMRSTAPHQCAHVPPCKIPSRQRLVLRSLSQGPHLRAERSKYPQTHDNAAVLDQETSLDDPWRPIRLDQKSLS